eukprot:TRINITY_DN10167_c0_g1_i1.p1 TRINITY_DN10167_c0_g1~~TRINITY_DN10167_c0_g1_i1.p1  ORF type:complete len:715 (+),score=159.14 TRINITY_DN10167_c0_g1_i1:145-2289(+)
MASIVQHGDAALLLRSLLDEEREKLSSFMQESNTRLVSRFERQFEELCQSAWTELLAPLHHYTVPGTFLKATRQATEQVQEPDLDTSLPAMPDCFVRAGGSLAHNALELGNASVIKQQTDDLFTAVIAVPSANGGVADVTASTKEDSKLLEASTADGLVRALQTPRMQGLVKTADSGVREQDSAEEAKREPSAKKANGVAFATENDADALDETPRNTSARPSPKASKSVSSSKLRDQDSESGCATASSSMNKLPPRSTKSHLFFREEAENAPWAMRLVKNPIFETVFAVVIFVNACSMGLEQQYIGINTGHKIEVPGVTRSAKETFPLAETLFLAGEYFFGIIFTLEVGVKIVILRCEFFKSLWNLYDSTIIVCWFVQSLSSMFSSSLDPQILRLARMARLLRLLRFAKAFQVFDVLHLLVHSMKACMSVLLWSALLLFVVMMGMAVVLIFFMQEQLENEDIAFEERLLLYTYFGTFTNGMFSMYELTMGNWVPISRTLVRNVSDWYMLLFMTYRTVVGFALLKVITAIFNAETLRVAQSDDGIMLMMKERQIKSHADKMHKLLAEGDESQDGFLSYDEFSQLLEDTRVQKWLAAQEIEVKDAGLAFKIVDVSGDGRVSAEELVRGFARLKGTAKSMDMVAVMHAFSRVELLLDRFDEMMCMQAQNSGSNINRKKYSVVLQNSVSAAFLHKQMDDEEDEESLEEEDDEDAREKD